MPHINHLIAAALLALFASVGFGQVETVTFRTAVSELRAEVNKAGTLTLDYASKEKTREAIKKGLLPTMHVNFDGLMKALTGDDETRSCALRLSASKNYRGTDTTRRINLPILKKQLAVLEKHQAAWGSVEPTEHSRKFKTFALDPAVKMLKEAIAGTNNQAWVETAKQMLFYFDTLDNYAKNGL